ncbi:TetR/AcrR family transcriptional regulator [Stackebrandtia nassauensis]|uniref:Transcriptional regulator, TetR family n=1 Tax=Stackebrandtia nassauensis (strain DSM 44728 / CIP 108903 / NRRL B-16338 / NBRC 102104 / LLR-40K-21) TaxID=446470 RepID=D3Q1J3_STANL|nr:TetR/AcrR family transcriptional regulator [Stackebrandtia nassauensis]ADD39841.1 transcriptional regulator, TetR family [Stackebrandtia nassauensis DSM 44728]
MPKPDTAQRIAEAALAILIAEGPKAVTMRRVAADAGVTTMASYRHFPNRETLLRTVADNAFAELGKTWGERDQLGDFDTRLRANLDDFLDFALTKPNLYTFLLTDRRDGNRQFPQDFGGDRSPAFAPLLATVEQGMRDGLLRSDDPLEVTLAIATTGMGLVDLYLGGRIGMPETEFRALCLRTAERVLNGCRS